MGHPVDELQNSSVCHLCFGTVFGVDGKNSTEKGEILIYSHRFGMMLLNKVNVMYGLKKDEKSRDTKICNMINFCNGILMDELQNYLFLPSLLFIQ